MSFKIAASDFDGTLFRGLNIAAEDIAAIRLWRRAGNKFGIVTGRPLVMLEPILKKFGVEVDFTVCGNGAIIHGGDGQIIFESELDKKILLDIMAEPLSSRSLHFAFESAEKFFCIIVKERSLLRAEMERLGLPLELITPAQIPSLPRINQLAMGFETPEESQAAADALNQKFGDKIFAQKNNDNLDIVAAGLNKAQGIENLLQLMSWSGAKIFVVGDEANDLPMIKKFGGYTVSTAKDFVKRSAKKIFDSVGDMLNHFGAA